MFMASLPPQSCIRGIPRNPEFIKITGRIKVLVTEGKKTVYIKAAARVNPRIKTTEPERVSISRGEIGELYKEEKTRKGIKKSARILSRVSSDRGTSLPIIKPLKIRIKRGSRIKKVSRNIKPVTPLKI